MTAGDPISFIDIVPPGGYWEIRPPVGVVWMVKNLYFGGVWELIRYKHPDMYQLIYRGSEAGALENRTMLVTNDIILVIKNNATAPIAMGFDGLVIQ